MGDRGSGVIGSWRAVTYNHFELKSIAFDEEKFPMLF